MELYVGMDVSLNSKSLPDHVLTIAESRPPSVS